VVFQLLYPGLWLFALLTATLLGGRLLLALLLREETFLAYGFVQHRRDTKPEAISYSEVREMVALTFTSVGPGLEKAAVTAGRLGGSSLVEITFTVVACVATGRA